MHMNRYYEIIEEQHTGFCACYQFIKWKIDNIAGYSNSNGLIVQKFKRVSVPENLIIGDISYYEAWLVENGKCIDTINQKYDDQFAVGHPMCQITTFRDSLNKIGEYRFQGKIFWIDREQDNELYTDVFNWPTNQVEQAGGLRAVYNSEKLKDKVPTFVRYPFIHKWSLSTCEEIYNAAKEFLFKMCPNPSAKRDQDIFEQSLNDMFGDEYKQIQEQLKEEWRKKLFP